MYLNRVELIGFLGRDAETKYTGTGTPVTTLSLATRQSWKKDGEWQERTEWHKIQVWGDASKYADRYKKGANLHVVGNLRSREYTGKNGKVRTYEIVAENVYERTPRPKSGVMPGLP